MLLDDDDSDGHPKAWLIFAVLCAAFILFLFVYAAIMLLGS